MKAWQKFRWTGFEPFWIPWNFYIVPLYSGSKPKRNVIKIFGRWGGGGVECVTFWWTSISSRGVIVLWVAFLGVGLRGRKEHFINLTSLTTAFKQIVKRSRWHEWNFISSFRFHHPLTSGDRLRKHNRTFKSRHLKQVRVWSCDWTPIRVVLKNSCSWVACKTRFTILSVSLKINGTFGLSHSKKTNNLSE